MTDIYFNEPDVLHYLLRNNEVFTVRHYVAETFGRIRTAKFGKLRFGTVRVETIGDLDDAMLYSYLLKSGFSTVEAWKEAIKRQQEKRKKYDKKHSTGSKLWVLRATVIEINPESLIECGCGYKVLKVEMGNMDWTCPKCGSRFPGAPGTIQATL